MKGFIILATIFILGNIYKSARCQGVLDEVLQRGAEKVELSAFSWTFATSGGVEDLTVCFQSNLSNTENVYSLTYSADNGTIEASYDNGILNESNPTCVSFSGSEGHELPDFYITYTLTVTNSSGEVVQYGSAHLRVQTESFSIDCNSPFPLYYRIEAAAGAVFNDCLSVDGTPENTCYKNGGIEGDITDMNICYTDNSSLPKNMRVCQKGLQVPDENKVVPGEALVIEYLAYSVDSTNAILKLTQNANITQVIFVTGNSGTTPAMCSYANGKCSIDVFHPQNIGYNVCGLATPTDSTEFTSVGTIQDFDVFVYADSDQLLDFGFANAHDQKWYSVTLLDAPDGNAVGDTIQLDCTDVQETHNCYGFLFLTGLEPVNIYLAVSFYNQTENATYNTVIVPYTKEETATKLQLQQLQQLQQKHHN